MQSCNTWSRHNNGKLKTRMSPYTMFTKVSSPGCHGAQEDFEFSSQMLFYSSLKNNDNNNLFSFICISINFLSNCNPLKTRENSILKLQENLYTTVNQRESVIPLFI